MSLKPGSRYTALQYSFIDELTTHLAELLSTNFGVCSLEAAGSATGPDHPHLIRYGGQ
jgi:hypothetical protein